MHRRSPSPAWTSALVVALAVVRLLCAEAHPASAANLFWNINVNGNAGTAANWSPVKVPTATDQLFFGKNVGIQVTFDASVDSVAAQTHTVGNIALNLQPSLTVNGIFTAGNAAADVATARVTAGSLHVL